MRIKSLDICNFRNYSRERVEFHPGTNVLYGDNAQGKTNILEAIYLGVTTRSHKNSRDSEIIKRGFDDAHIKYIIEKNGNEKEVELHLKKRGKKGIAINGVPIKKSTDLFGVSNVVFFSPEDLDIIRNGPDERRHFIDMELCQIDKIYMYYLTIYKKNLKQRNALLKSIGENKSSGRDMLSVWNEKLVEAGKVVIEKRSEFISEINEIMQKKHKDITGGKECIGVKYEPNVSSEFFLEKLFLQEDKDVLLGTTSVGPHRDDVAFFNGDEDVRKFGSQGQKRTAALSLKLAEIEIVKDRMDDTPILLLDDVLSELDRGRQSFLLENIDDVQTIVTCTGLEEFVASGVGINRVFQVSEGTVCRK